MLGRDGLRKPILAAAFVLFAICPLLDAQVSDRPASVVVAVAAGPDADAAFGPVLRDALLVSLARNHMKPSPAETFDEARASSARGGADYLVLGTWSSTDETLELTIEVWLPGGTAALAAAKASGRISLTMDALAGEAMEKLLPSMQSRFPAEPAAAQATAASTTAARDGAPTGTTGGGAAAAATTAGSDAVVATDGAVAAAAAETTARWRRVELSFGGAPLVATGTVAEYAKIGAFSALDLDFRFPVGGSILAPGLLVSAGWFRAAGIGVADVLMVPVGPDLHWTISSAANPGVSLHAAAGPAAIVAITSWAGTLVKISPFVAGGIVVDVGLTPALGLRVEAEYSAVFEGSMVLQGFTPRLSLRTRF